MNFENIVTTLNPFFLDQKFAIVEQRKDYVKYEYNELAIAICRDWRNNSISVFVEQDRKEVVELSDDVLTNFFNSETKLRYDDTFAADLVAFFSKKGIALLKGDIDTIARLNDFSNQKAKEYTDDLLKRQSITAADAAWNNRNYPEFIKQLDRIPKSWLPETYQMKYQYALKNKD